MQQPSPYPREGRGTARTLPAILRLRTVQQPDDLAFVFVPSAADGEARSLTYRRLDFRARAVAARLGGVAAPGSRVLLDLPPGPDLAAALFGCLAAGMVAVPVASSAMDRAQHLGPALLGCAPAAVLTARRPGPGRRDLGGVPVLEAGESLIGGVPVEELARDRRPLGILPSSTAYLSHRAGTDQLVAFSHVDLMGMLATLSRTARQGLDERHLGWLAEVHGLGLAWRLMLPVLQGRTAWIQLCRPTRGARGTSHD